MMINERIKRMREEFDEKQDQIKTIENHRRQIEIEQEIVDKRREYEAIDKKIDEERKLEREMTQNEGKFRDFDQKLQHQENSNPN